MPPDLIIFIARYGYLAIFILVFAQEIGIPNPVPNELVLMFSGYLIFKGILFFPFVILITMSADFIGTSILYIVFYFFGDYILKHKPRWLPISDKTINKVSARISKGGLSTIYICRLLPFIRGYTSVITGLLQIKPNVFLPIALISAATWSSVYVLTGRILSPFLNFSEIKTGKVKLAMLITVIVILTVIIMVRYLKKRSALKLK